MPPRTSLSDNLISSVQAHICLGDAFLAMDHIDAAESSYTAALEIDPSLRRSKSFKARITKLQEKLASGNTR